MPSIRGWGCPRRKSDKEYVIGSTCKVGAGIKHHLKPTLIRSTLVDQGVGINQVIRVLDSYPHDSRVCICISHAQIGKDHHRIPPQHDRKGRCGATQIKVLSISRLRHPQQSKQRHRTKPRPGHEASPKKMNQRRIGF